MHIFDFLAAPTRYGVPTVGSEVENEYTAASARIRLAFPKLVLE